MIALVVIAYFLCLFGALALLLFPPARRRFSRAGGAFVSACGYWLAAIRRPAGGRVPKAARAVRVRARAALPAGRSMILGAALLCVPLLVAVHMGGTSPVDPVGPATSPDRRIATLLAGERLVPPPALPPEIFASLEVERLDSIPSVTSRDWDQLDERFRQRLLAVVRLMREQHGRELVLLEGYRSPERQSFLAARGRHITRAAAHESYHQFGLAADVAFLRDGKLVISEQDPWAMRGYELLGQIAEQAGLTWGGRWEIRDLGHLELRASGRSILAAR